MHLFTFVLLFRYAFVTLFCESHDQYATSHTHTQQHVAVASQPYADAALLLPFHVCMVGEGDVGIVHFAAAHPDDEQRQGSKFRFAFFFFG
jgi:hypothetical protein